MTNKPSRNRSVRVALSCAAYSPRGPWMLRSGACSGDVQVGAWEAGRLTVRRSTTAPYCTQGAHRGSTARLSTGVYGVRVVHVSSAWRTSGISRRGGGQLDATTQTPPPGPPFPDSDTPGLYPSDTRGVSGFRFPGWFL